MRRRSFLGVAGGIPLLALAPSVAVSAAPSTAKKLSVAVSKKVGIAFGGGSTHGMAHIGVLKALCERGMKFQIITGTSVGAIVGVLAAANMPIREIEKIARQIEWPGVMNFAWSSRGLLNNNKLRTIIDVAISNRRLDQLPIPFAAIATDMTNGERVILRNAPAGLAIDASCSIPVLFEPVNFAGRSLVDGGLTEPVPVIAAREMGADIVIGVDVAYRPYEAQHSGLTGAAFQTMHIMANALINAQIGRADVAIRMKLHHFIDKENTKDQLIAAGYAAANRAWPEIAAVLA